MEPDPIFSAWNLLPAPHFSQPQGLAMVYRPLGSGLPSALTSSPDVVPLTLLRPPASLLFFPVSDALPPHSPALAVPSVWVALP